ncbi:hypothetical protein HK097_004766 [Rhizophlyctis rosea]|uniref:Uncharacterized protein n=1 Tax=Rhizophlyctis rosea TaxID=64517 RepID=A0AAD5SH47_9FUNG|nr:hypothetical protein HK097_004766 [Rhizophlyctis rosea]
MSDDPFDARMDVLSKLRDGKGAQSAWTPNQVGKATEYFRRVKFQENLLIWFQDALDETMSGSVLSVFHRRNVLDVMERMLDEHGKDPRAWESAVSKLDWDQMRKLLCSVMEYKKGEKAPNANCQSVRRVLANGCRRRFARKAIDAFIEELEKAEEERSLEPIPPLYPRMWRWDDADRKKVVEPVIGRMEIDRDRTKNAREDRYILQHVRDDQTTGIMENDPLLCINWDNTEDITDDLDWVDEEEEEIPPPKTEWDDRPAGHERRHSGSSYSHPSYPSTPHHDSQRPASPFLDSHRPPPPPEGIPYGAPQQPREDYYAYHNRRHVHGPGSRYHPYDRREAHGGLVNGYAGDGPYGGRPLPMK